MLNPYVPEHGTLKGIEARLEQQLDPAARTWLHQACAAATRAARAAQAAQGAKGTRAAEPAEAPRPAAWEADFASAGRHCGRAAARDARVLLLHAAGAGTSTVTRLYHQGTASERAAVLCALPHLPAGGTTDAVPLVEDALRANDTTLIGAAVGPYAAARLDPHGWRHAVLKCLFTGVPLSAVAGLAHRARGDAELARMLSDFAHERTAAGRSVPADLNLVLDLADTPAPPPEEF